MCPDITHPVANPTNTTEDSAVCPCQQRNGQEKLNYQGDALCWNNCLSFSFSRLPMKPTTTVTLTLLEQSVLVGLLASVIRDLGAPDPLAIELTRIKLAVEGFPPDLALAA